MENVAREIQIVGNNIDISATVKGNSKPKKDRINSQILSEEEYFSEVHSADAITSQNDIDDLIIGLAEKGDYTTMAFLIVGFNIGYRPVDILAWRWNQIIDQTGKLMKTFAIPEHKTGKTAVVNLNDTAYRVLEWYHEYKRRNEKLFSEENFIFTTCQTKGQKSYVWYEKSMNRFWHTDKKHKEKGLMYSYADGETIVCDEEEILNDTERYIKLRKPIDTDSISKNTLAMAKKLGIKLHLSSYTCRQTFSYWFRKTLTEDSTLASVSDMYFSTYLLSGYFNHSNMKITENHYMRDMSKIFAEVVSKMSIGKDGFDCVTMSLTEDYGMQLSM